MDSGVLFVALFVCAILVQFFIALYMARSKVQLQQHLLCRSSGQRCPAKLARLEMCSFKGKPDQQQGSLSPWAKASAERVPALASRKNNIKGVSTSAYFVLKIQYHALDQPNLNISRTSRYLVGLRLETKNSFTSFRLQFDEFTRQILICAVNFHNWC